MGSTHLESLGFTVLKAGGTAGSTEPGKTTIPQIIVGSGVPTVSAPQGSIYLRSDGTAAYSNQDGAATWVAMNVAVALAIAGQTAGDVFVATSATAIGRVADVALKQVLMSGGVGAAPAYSGSPEVSGTVRADTKETDGGIFIPGIEFNVDAGGGAFVKTRSAIGDYIFLHTTAADTTVLYINLSRFVGLTKVGADPGAHDIRGVRLKSIDVMYKNTTGDLVAFSAAVRQTVYANGVGNAVSTPSALTGALTLTAAATPRIVNLVVATPYTVGNNAVDTADWIELSVQTAANSVFSLNGLYLNCDYNLL